MPELCFVPDNAFPVTVGEKTLLRFFAKSVAPFRQIVSVSGGDRFNVVLGEAVCKIKRTTELEAELKEKIADKDEYSINSDGDCITLTARGLSSHAAMPEGSVCAAKLIADLLAECSALDETDRKIMKSAAYLLTDPYATALNAAHEDSRFGKTTASTGIITTEDGMLKFSYDMRYAPDAYGPDILTKLENQLASYGFSLIEPELDEGFDLGDDTPLSRKITEIYSSVFPGENSHPARSGGGTYARYLKNAYSIGVCAPHTTPELEMPAGHGGAHQPDEKIAIEGFFAALKVITMMVVGCDEIL